MVFWFTTDHFKFLVVPMRGLNGAIEAGASFSLIIHSIGGCRFAVWPSSFPPGPLPACTYACTSSSLSASGCSCPGGACAPIATAPPFSSPPPPTLFPLPGIQYFLGQFPCPPRTVVSRALFGEALLLRHRDTASLRTPRSLRANQKRSCSACVK